MKKFNYIVLFLLLSTFTFQLLLCQEANNNPQILAKLKSIDHEKKENQLIVHIVLEGQYSSKIFELESPSRIVCEFSPVEQATFPEDIEVNSVSISTIRIIKINLDTVQVIFYLKDSNISFETKPTSDGLDVFFNNPQPNQLDYQTSTSQTRASKLNSEQQKIIFPSFGNTVIDVTYSNQFMSSETYNKIYGNVASLFGFSLSRTLFKKNNHFFLLSLGFSYLSSSGSSTVTKESTKFSLIPYSISARYMANQNYVIPFFGAGAELFQYKEKSDIHSISGSDWGYHFEGGTYLKIPPLKLLMLKLYLKISKRIAKEENFELDLGGFEFGLGLSFAFDIWKNISL